MLRLKVARIAWLPSVVALPIIALSALRTYAHRIKNAFFSHRRINAHFRGAKAPHR